MKSVCFRPEKSAGELRRKTGRKRVMISLLSIRIPSEPERSARMSELRGWLIQNRRRGKKRENPLRILSFSFR